MERSGVYTEQYCDMNIQGRHAVVIVGYGNLNGIDYWVNTSGLSDSVWFWFGVRLIRCQYIVRFWPDGYAIRAVLL